MKETKLFLILCITVCIFMGLSMTAFCAPTVTGISVSPTTATFTGPNITGDSLAVTATYSDGSTKDVSALSTFSTSSSAIAKVVSGKLVSGTTAGTATITVKYSGYSATCAVTQARQLKAITVSPTMATITGPNKTSSTLRVVASYTNTTATVDVSTSATFASSDVGIVTVVNRVLTSGTKVGTAAVTATYQEKTATCTVTVNPSLVSLTLTPNKVTLAGPNVTGDALAVTGNYSDGSTKDVTAGAIFKSSNSAVVLIVSGKLVSGTTAGTATVTASYGGRSTTCAVTQARQLKAITVSPTTAAISGPNVTSSTLKAVASYTNTTATADVSTTTTFTSSDTDIVTITNRVLKSSTKAGIATVAATYQGATANCTVTVNASLTSITLTPKTTTISGPNITGDTLVVTGIYSDGSTKDVTAGATFKSSNSAVVSIVGGKLVSGTTAGTATVTTSYGGKSATCAVTQARQVKSIALTPTTAAISEPNVTSSTLKAVASYTNTTATADVSTAATFTSSDTEIVTITNRVLKSGIKSGTATVTATYQSATATCTVTAKPGLLGIVLIPNISAIAGPSTTGDTLKVMTNVSDGTSADVSASATYKSSNTSVVTVTNRVLKSGTVVGTATVTATYSGKTATCTVTTLPKISSISVTPTKANIGGNNISGPTVQVTATFTDNSTKDVTNLATITSSDSTIAFASGGVIKSGDKEGTATLTVSIGGKTQTITVVVAKLNDNQVVVKNLTGVHGEVTKLTVNLQSNTIAGLNKEGGKVTVLATFTDGYVLNVTNKTMYSTPNGKIALVTKNKAGVKVVKSGSKEGTVKITAIFGGVKQAFTITVTK